MDTVTSEMLLRFLAALASKMGVTPKQLADSIVSLDKNWIGDFAQEFENEVMKAIEDKNKKKNG